MPLFRPKEFILPSEPSEALAKLKAGGKRARIIAGGTGFYELAKRGYVPEVKNVVSIMKLGLDYVRENEKEIRIGATTILQSLLELGIGERRGLEALGDALREIRPVQVRNVATVGGEICISVPIVDLPTALLACEASLGVMSSDGERFLKLDDFYIDAFLTKLDYGEIVSEVILPQKRGVVASSFGKIGRTAYDFNLVNSAVSVNLDRGKIVSIRTFLGGIKRIPLRAIEFEKKLVGKSDLDETMIFDAAAASFTKESFLPSVHGSSEYKHAILPVLLRDCTLKAIDRAAKLS